MPKFADALNREWELRLTVADVPRLRAVGCDLGPMVKDAKAGGLMAIYALQPWEMGAVLWELCSRQAEPKGISPEQFAEGFDGEAIDRARECLMGAAFDFFHRPAVAGQMKTNFPKLLEKMDREAGAKIETILNGSNGSAGNSPASPVLTPAD